MVMKQYKTFVKKMNRTNKEQPLCEECGRLLSREEVDYCDACLWQFGKEDDEG